MSRQRRPYASGDVSGTSVGSRRRSAGYRKGKNRAVPRFTADLGGTRDGRRLAIYVATACKGDRLGGQRFPVRFPASFALRFGASARLRLSGRCGGCGVGVVGFRYTPREASQFAHVFALYAGPHAGGVRCGCAGFPAVLRARRRRHCQLLMQRPFPKKELGCRAQKGDLVQGDRYQNYPGPPGTVSDRQRWRKRC